jgi:hypothetical protein
MNGVSNNNANENNNEMQRQKTHSLTRVVMAKSLTLYDTKKDRKGKY